MIAYSRRMLAVATITLATGSLYAQPDTGQLFRWFDRNQNGTLDADEMDRMPESLRSRIQGQGYDLKGEIGPEALEQTGQRTFVQFQPRDDNRSGRDDDDDDDRDRDDEERYRSFGGGDFGGGDFGSRFGGGRFGGRWGEEEVEGDRDEEDDGEEAKPRITFDLPASFLAGDLDQDGQIAFYEWRRWQRTKISEFRALDLNGDGLLTPRELQQQQAPAGGASVAASPVRAVPGSVTTTTVGAPSASYAVSSAAPAEDDAILQRAKAYFDALDADKDGQVTAEEFAKSNRLKGMFEKAGIDLTPTRSLDEFVAAYVQVTQAS